MIGMAMHGVWLAECGNKVEAMKILVTIFQKKEVMPEDDQTQQGGQIELTEEETMFVSGAGQWTCQNWSCTYSW